MSVGLEGVGAGYGRRQVLHGIDLGFAAGTVTALLGPNGSGKSTLLKAVAGLIPHTGLIAIGNGMERIGYLPQDVPSNAHLNVLETVLLGRLHGLGLRIPPDEVAAAAAALELLDLGALADRRLSELSGGQRQMVYLAQALAGEPHILLLDEPTSALDLRNQVEVLTTIRRVTRGRTHALTTILAIHDLNAAARFADRLVLLQDGRVRAAGAAADVLRPERIAEVYGIQAYVYAGPDGQPTVTPYRAVSLGGAAG